MSGSRQKDIFTENSQKCAKGIEETIWIDYVQRRLSHEQQLNLQQHLHACPGCQQQVAYWRELLPNESNHILEASRQHTPHCPAPSYTASSKWKWSYYMNLAFNRLSYQLKACRSSLQLKTALAATIIMLITGGLLLSSYSTSLQPSEQASHRLRHVAFEGQLMDKQPDNAAHDAAHDAALTYLHRLAADSMPVQKSENVVYLVPSNDLLTFYLVDNQLNVLHIMNSEQLIQLLENEHSLENINIEDTSIRLANFNSRK